MISLHPAIFAVGLVLAVSAAGSGDYELTLIPSGEVVCATSAEACEAAVRALRLRLWIPLGEERTTDGTCTPLPNCFPERSRCIRGYNCR